MKLIKIKRGYTLAEIMIVLLVLTIIFAAFAPFFTKRSMTSANGKYAVWTHDRSEDMNAYTYPGDDNLHGQMFFGMSPMSKDAVESEFNPLSKLVIRANTIDNKFQRHIQFRYGRKSVTDGGKFAGTWSVVNNNIFLGSGFKNLDTQLPAPMNIKALDTTLGARNNVAVGYGALNNVMTARNNVAVGYNALTKLAIDFNQNIAGLPLVYNGAKNVALGYQAGYSLTGGKNNVFAGYNAGYTTSTMNNNTFVGYMAGYNAGGSYNTFIGYRAGYSNSTGQDNLAIGAYALQNLTGDTSKNNVAIGYHALGNLQSGSNNVAIGYGACSEIKNSSNKTCIGYNSGPHSGSSADKVTNAINGGDTTYRTYIGSKPSNYGGDAVLEIHNMSTTSPGISRLGAGSLSNTTTVINGNLIIKGRPYFTVGNTLHHFHDKGYVYDAKSGVRFYGKAANSTMNANTYASCSTTLKSYYFGSCVDLQNPTVTSTSDRRLKNISTRSTAGLAEINKLKVYNFTFKDDENKLPQIGVMAQDLQKVFPHSVFKNEDGYLRIKWDEMFYAAINAIKELDKKIVALVNRTTKVETQISKLEKENILLKSQVNNLTTRINKLKTE